MQEELKETI
jgi:hypothetical protein